MLVDAEINWRCLSDKALSPNFIVREGDTLSDSFASLPPEHLLATPDFFSLSWLLCVLLSILIL
jgi:hypothetical protein